MRDVTERRAAQREREAAQHRFAVLAELAQTLSQTLDPDAVGERIAEHARTLLRARASMLYRLSAEGARRRRHRGRGGPGVHARLRAGAGRGDGVARGARAPAGRVPDVLADARVDALPELRTRVERADYRSVLAVPLVGEGQRRRRVRDRRPARAACSARTRSASRRPSPITRRSRWRTRGVFALETARRAQMESLAAIERDLAAELDPERLLALIIEHVGQLLPRRCPACTSSTGRGGCVRRAWSDRARTAPRRSTSASAWSAASPTGAGSSPTTTRGGRTRPKRSARPARVTPWRSRSIVHGRLLGVVSVGRLEPTAPAFTPDEYEILGRLATQAAVAIENARLYAEAAAGSAKRR